jgi:hypothetical protein
VKNPPLAVPSEFCSSKHTAKVLWILYLMSI